MAARGLGRWSAGLAVLSLVALLAGCSTTTVTITGTNTTGAGATPTATSAGGGSAPTATPTQAPPHALAWSQLDSHNVPQIWASLNGGNPQQITHVAPDGSECDDQVGWSPPVFSPDLTHIVASLGSYNCGDAPLNGPVSIITVSNGHVQTLASTDAVDQDARTMGWLDNSHIWFISYSPTTGGIERYTLGAGAPTAIYGGSNIDITDAVYRQGDIIFQVGNAAANTESWTIEFVNVQTHTLEGNLINQGQTGLCHCGSGVPHGPGWDVAGDGAHITYQYVTPNTTTMAGVASSKIYTSGTDGSNKTQIAKAMITTATCVLQYSWDGQWVAFTEAPPSPATLTASVNTPGSSGDPNFHGYSPDTSDYPVWKWDNSQFWATGSNGVYNFHRNGSSSLGIVHGMNPWYTIGG